MTDVPPPLQLFAKRRHIYVRAVSGRYRALKWAAMAVLLFIYYAAPFLRWDRGPHAPDQALLIDMPNRRGYFFFIEIWPQEVYYLTGILILSAISLFFVTSLLGRVWCGYACPQTVWTDLFLAVERFFQGAPHQHRKRDENLWSLDTLWRKAATHATWLLIALCTGGAWVFYFNDAPTLVDNIRHLTVSPTVLGWIGLLTLTTYVFAGFAREQVCIYMCPYARFQSAMFDKDTLLIGYDTRRGEPRGKHKAGTPWDGRGHCVDCDQCVQVCPMGIDIRHGLQMECIACGLCVDACNTVMDKVDLPRGLIRYDTARNQERRAQGLPDENRLFRPRTFYYTAVLALVAGVIVYGLLTRQPTELHILHDRNPLFVTLSDGHIRNGYDLKILNKTLDDAHYKLELTGLPDATVRLQGAGDLTTTDVTVFADSVGHLRAFVTAPAQAQPRAEVGFVLTNLATGHTVTEYSLFMSEMP